MSDSVVDFDRLRDLITAGSSGVVDARSDLHRALAELDWNASRPAVAQARENLITPEQAASIAGVPKRTIYDWAADKAWASRPSRRCLRIAERGFRNWLEQKKGDR